MIAEWHATFIRNFIHFMTGEEIVTTISINRDMSLLSAQIIAGWLLFSIEWLLLCGAVITLVAYIYRPKYY